MEPFVGIVWEGLGLSVEPARPHIHLVQAFLHAPKPCVSGSLYRQTRGAVLTFNWLQVTHQFMERVKSNQIEAPDRQEQRRITEQGHHVARNQG